MSRALSTRDVLGLLGLAAVLPPARLLLLAAGGFELHFDEAQYWEWSRRLDWSYYSKGPLVAWLIGLSTGLLGDGEWQVRLPAWLAYDAFLLALFALARELWGTTRAGWWGVALGLATPIFALLGGVMTTDVFLFLFWAWGLWAAVRAVAGGRVRAWYVLGAAVGIGALGKLSIGLLPLFLALYLIATPGGRGALASPHPWAAGVLALALMSPVILWNAGHDWVMLRHEQGHVAPGGGPAYLPEFVLGQWLALSPLLAILLAARLWRPPADGGQRLVWWVSVAALAFFLLKAATGKVQVNWPAPAYIGLLALFAGRVPTLGPGPRRLLRGGFLVSALLTALAFFPGLAGLPGDRDPFAAMKAWRGPVGELARQAGPADFVLTRRYALATELAFYWPGPTTVYLTGDAARRMSQYDLWPDVSREVGRDGVYVDTRPALPAQVAQAFARCAPLDPVPALARDGTVLRTLYGWRCAGLRAVDWPRPGRY